MKKLNYIFAGLFLVSMFSFVACKSDASENEDGADTSSVVDQLEETMEDIEAKDSTSVEEGSSDKLANAKYICPNRCKGSGSGELGECKNPECGMELMENPTYEKE